MKQKVDSEALLKKYPELDDCKVGPFNITTLQIFCAFNLTELIKSQFSSTKITKSYINLANDLGRSALHYAAFNNNIEIVELLILNGAEVNRNTKIINTAEEHIIDDKWNALKDELYGASCDNPETISPLYCAVYNKSFDAFKLLIQKGADVLNKTVEYNEILEKCLHYNTLDFLDFFDIILQNLTPEDEIYDNIIKVAVNFNHPINLQFVLKKMFNENTSVVNIKLLLKWQLRAASLGNAEVLKVLSYWAIDLGYMEEGKTLIENIFNNISRPNMFILDLMNKHITLNQREEFCEIIIDFSILLSNNKSQMDVLNNLCDSADNEEIRDLIKHPLIETFLKIKWAKVRAFFTCQILIYLIFVLSLSTFVLLHLRKTTNLGITCVIVKYVLILSALESFVHSFLQLALSFRKSHSKYEILMNMVCTILALLISAVGENPVVKDDLNWILHAMSVSVLLAWAELMLLIGRLPTYGYYALMFTAVLQNVIKVLLTFICLIIGFSLSFLIQFSDSHQFENPWLAVVKTTVMMMGEYEYADLFSNGNDKIIRLPATSRIIFMLFIILVSIVLMNLMIGLAVSDIQDLKKDGHVRRHLKQVDFLKSLEEFLFLLEKMNTKISFIKQLTKVLKKKIEVEPKITIHSEKRHRKNLELPKKYIDNLFINLGRRNKKLNHSYSSSMEDTP